MPKDKSFQKSLQIYLSKLIKPISTQLPIHPNTINSPSNWILSGCRHPKTSSFSVDQNQSNTHKNGDDDNAATLTDIDHFLFENFNSLYCNTNNSDGNKNSGGGGAANQRCKICSPRAFLFESPRLGDATPHVRPSNRFFVSPSTSNSLLEDTRSTLLGETGSSSTTLRESMALSAKIKSLNLELPDESIAVLTYSRDPYEDFRQSMAEMIKARLSQDESVDWEFMEELLFCYLKLNDKKSYKYILGAFVDLMVILRQNSGSSPGKPRKIKTTATSRKRTKKGEKRRKGHVT
ncbi:transcription repressor OFP14-like [Telopea speciosissima]|uniref:transcription repressor OFP14-like n=1 Tax=Telopea speciosissima TaxID=54955 RepID=UPI001CC69D72|nr:transcription repressor OFP14-like [Telopea speciosissima]